MPYNVGMAIKVLSRSEQEALLPEEDEILSDDGPGAMFTDDGFGEDHLLDMFNGDTIIFGCVNYYL